MEKRTIDGKVFDVYTVRKGIEVIRPEGQRPLPSVRVMDMINVLKSKGYEFKPFNGEIIAEEELPAGAKPADLLRSGNPDWTWCYGDSKLRLVAKGILEGKISLNMTVGKRFDLSTEDKSDLWGQWARCGNLMGFFNPETRTVQWFGEVEDAPLPYAGAAKQIEDEWTALG
jgi:hypothetical protein